MKKRKRRKIQIQTAGFAELSTGGHSIDLPDADALKDGEQNYRAGSFQTKEKSSLHSRESPFRTDSGRTKKKVGARREKTENKDGGTDFLESSNEMTAASFEDGYGRRDAGKPISGSGYRRRHTEKGKNICGGQKASDRKSDVFQVMEEPEGMQDFVQEDPDIPAFGAYCDPDAEFLTDSVEKISKQHDQQNRTPHVSRRTEVYQKRAEKSVEKLKRAEDRLPIQKSFRPNVFKNAETGKIGVQFKVVETLKPWKNNVLQKGKRAVAVGTVNYVRSQIRQELDDDSLAGVVLDKSERAAEGTVSAVKYVSQRRVYRLNQKAQKLGKKHFKTQGKYLYRKYLDEHPEMKRKLFRKQMQKKKMQREYKKTYRRAKQNENIQIRTGRGAQFTAAISRKLKEFLTKSRAFLITLSAAAVFLIIVSAGFSSCVMMFSDTVSTTMFSSWLSDPKEINAAELLLTEKEVELQEKIDRIEEDYQGYDEYRYNLGEIGHNPFDLVDYLSAKYVDFSFGDAEPEINHIFQEMYVLTKTEVVEKRTRTEVREEVDDETGVKTEVEVEVEYDYYILEVKLEVKPLASITSRELDNEQKELYAAYQESKGGLQQLASPLELNWYAYVSSYYGYRMKPFSKQKQLHRGLDIAVPEGTAVYAGQSGKVTTAGYHDEYGNYIVIEDEDGLISKYAHLSGMDVAAGQEVEVGEKIGRTGSTGSSTGSHLHIEILFGGEYYNPLFFFDVGIGTLYGEAPGNGGAVPPGTYDDVIIQRLMEEAARYMGMPYTFGGTPPESFDCSGYVCWVYSNSGAYDLPRTTAQGIYDQCRYISPGEARAGDLIFFTGTYNAGRPVTHVGIYCGNGGMAHCGSPIQYSNINTSYWQSHFYGWGRLLE